ncbi:MAG TPA: DUF3501 family protein [Acidimicrobiia bacterium]|nr:DUF3501 family protein [Acidimicrobiia bacterium]
MRKLTDADIKDLREYERERDAFRAEIIATKKKRRIPVGDLMSIVFENAATMRFQIQEMARAERMLRDEQIARELETYNELIPADGELSGTLFIEITDAEALQYWLPRLVGIHEYLRFVVGDSTVPGRPENVDRLTREATTTTVHYLKFAFSPEQQQAFADGPVRLVVDHPEYQADVTLTDEQCDELVGDFAA